jgi:hypothetical protein
MTVWRNIENGHGFRPESTEIEGLVFLPNGHRFRSESTRNVADSLVAPQPKMLSTVKSSSDIRGCSNIKVERD